MIPEQLMFLSNVEKILQEEIIEGHHLSNIDVLKAIAEDKHLMKLFFRGILNNYSYEDGLKVSFSKTQFFVYRLNMVINDWMKSIHNISDISEIKLNLSYLLLENVDFYSAVSYNDSDRILIDEISTLPSLNFKL